MSSLYRPVGFLWRVKSRKNEILRGELHIAGSSYSSVLQSFVLASTYRLPPSNHMVFHQPWPCRFKLLGPVDDLVDHFSTSSGLDVRRPTPYSPRRHISDHITMPACHHPPKSSHVIRHPARCHSAETMYCLSVEWPHRAFFLLQVILISVNRRLVFFSSLPLRGTFIQRTHILPTFAGAVFFLFRCATGSFNDRISLFYILALLLWLCRAAGLRVDEFYIDFLRLHLCNEADLHSSTTFATRAHIIVNVV
ncbi:hypothetical protein C8F04DRAFT_1067480 [Mycena alexandri]|uniref:Uncharacterized protein n=1 Tax=Mycena alexandri TaxID=1745969 RepID=A0AAD6TEF4_9AGAR|nr:hypothetical protein C8F04DRAFT_1067480 [Mycena alexandri]